MSNHEIFQSKEKSKDLKNKNGRNGKQKVTQVVAKVQILAKEGHRFLPRRDTLDLDGHVFGEIY